ncbi:MAG TPA: class I SAM-dependent methyltransferase [Blastocatellia bacterium]|nr:class I SAM-dependent methyltransferase [Blastocatellia bacterium]
MPLDVKRIWDACGRAFDRFNSTDDSYSEIIERPAIRELVGDVAGARVLDLGCGAGPYSLWFAERGAQVSGLDLSETMAALAHQKARELGLKLDLQMADIREPLPFAEAEFDLVFTATALHYVDDLRGLFKEIGRVMKRDGQLVASVLHPNSTAYFPLARGKDQREPQYFGEPTRSIETPWLDYGEVPDEGRRIVCRHHTAAEYFNAIFAAGLRVTDVREPEPPAEYASQNASRYEEAMRVPVYLIFKAKHPTVEPL